VDGIAAVRLIGGGSQSPLWRQIMADCFRRPVHTLALKTEATAWGAAVAGGVGVGLYTWEIAQQQAQIVATTYPDPAHVAAYDELAVLFADAYAALAPLYARLQRFN
jgi:xylulokinase